MSEDTVEISGADNFLHKTCGDCGYYRDALTGLLSRIHFAELIESTLNKSKLESMSHALCILNLDDFKVINDIHGCSFGDDVLKLISQLLTAEIDTSETLTRLGGDEFGFILVAPTTNDSFLLAERIIRKVRDVFTISNKQVSITASVGLAEFHLSVTEHNEIIKRANVAHSIAKERGGDLVFWYDEQNEIQKKALHLRYWAGEIKRIIGINRLYLFCQEIAPLQNKLPSNYEVLIRAKDEDGNLIMPGEFLPAAEKYNLIVDIDKWVIENLKRWMESNAEVIKYIDRFSVNLSGASLNKASFTDYLLDILRSSPVFAKKVKFELTESVSINCIASLRLFMLEAQSMGCKFSLDDFGTGISSFEYLNSLPFNEIKIDGMFVSGLTENTVHFQIISAINSIAHSMGMDTVIECVEDEWVKKIVKKMGIDYAQGYLIGKPKPVGDLMFMA